MLTADQSLQGKAFLIAYAGLLPLVAGVAMILALEPDPKIVQAMKVYAAIILTFVGALHWGRGLQLGSKKLLLMSIVTSLIAWPALLIPPLWSFPLLMVGFAIQLLLDLQILQVRGWFMKLRQQLTIAVCAIICVSWMQIYLRSGGL